LAIKPFRREPVMSSILRQSIIVYLGAVLVSTGHAQLTAFYPIGADAVSLNNADFTMLIDAANGLLRRPQLSRGAKANWRNEQTGSSGTISVTKTFHEDAMLCHALTYETIPMATPPANRIVLNWCKTRDGEWKILS
jgi:surface antigen